MCTRRLIFLINYLVLAASCAYGFDSPRLGVFLSVGIALFGALFALVCISLGIVVHRSFPKKHERASDFPELLTTGPYAYVRHPFYSVLIALNYAISIVFVSIYAVIASTLVIPLWWYLAKSEEVDLVHVWGKRYIEYRKKVPMFFPRARQQTMNSRSE